ncbi:MAG: hypothetical protein Q7R47_03060 [Candidatus Diapherotrites archaeon]|nr:hypothetical protein [Candidatus Diapherotrites archaeon]
MDKRCLIAFLLLACFVSVFARTTSIAFNPQKMTIELLAVRGEDRSFDEMSFDEPFAFIPRLDQYPVRICFEIKSGVSAWNWKKEYHERYSIGFDGDSIQDVFTVNASESMPVHPVHKTISDCTPLIGKPDSLEALRNNTIYYRAGTAGTFVPKPDARQMIVSVALLDASGAVVLDRSGKPVGNHLVLNSKNLLPDSVILAKSVKSTPDGSQISWQKPADGATRYLLAGFEKPVVFYPEDSSSENFVGLNANALGLERVGSQIQISAQSGDTQIAAAVIAVLRSAQSALPSTVSQDLRLVFVFDTALKAKLQEKYGSDVLTVLSEEMRLSVNGGPLVEGSDFDLSGDTVTIHGFGPLSSQSQKQVRIQIPLRRFPDASGADVSVSVTAEKFARSPVYKVVLVENAVSGS